MNFFQTKLEKVFANIDSFMLLNAQPKTIEMVVFANGSQDKGKSYVTWVRNDEDYIPQKFIVNNLSCVDLFKFHSVTFQKSLEVGM